MIKALCAPSVAFPLCCNWADGLKFNLATRIAASILLGWNEKRDVCEQAAILCPLAARK